MTKYEEEQMAMLSNLLTLSTLIKNYQATKKVDVKQLRIACTNFLNNSNIINHHVMQLEAALTRDLVKKEAKSDVK